MGASRTPVGIDHGSLAERYQRVRDLTLRLCEPLCPEDMVVQVEPHASPTKWHLAHTTWFFETFVLGDYETGYSPYDERFCVLFNSYYNAVGEQHPRPRRGVLTRPGIGEVMAYRDTIDERVRTLIAGCNERTLCAIAPLIELGLQHEQQHQELMLTDIKVLFAANPLLPSYREVDRDWPPGSSSPQGWVGFEGGVVEIGHEGDNFAYDNEGPRHRRFLEPYELADRLVTNGEFLAFVEDRGYERPELWLDEGWAWVRDGHRCPAYWSKAKGQWHEFTLDGRRSLDLSTPVCHVSFYEADAYARWAGARLPTECEYEHATAGVEPAGNFVESDQLHPRPATGTGVRQLFGDVWEWTRSAHEPYPGYSPPKGAIGEYNGKFMCGTYVLRGGSCVTSETHIRPTYRNFLSPASVWQFSGFRLARST